MRELEQLDRLDDDLIATILEMTPGEAMEGIGGEELAAMRSRVSAAAAEVGRARLARARNAAISDATRPKPKQTPHGAAALAEIRANDNAFDEKLTLAARSGGADYEADRAGIEADLEELREDEERGDRD